MWNLEPNTQKCLKEELQQNVLITGEFEVSEAPGQKIDYVVRVVTISIHICVTNIYKLYLYCRYEIPKATYCHNEKIFPKENSHL